MCPMNSSWIATWTLRIPGTVRKSRLRDRSSKLCWHLFLPRLAPMWRSAQWRALSRTNDHCLLWSLFYSALKTWNAQYSTRSCQHRMDIQFIDYFSSQIHNWHSLFPFVNAHYGFRGNLSIRNSERFRLWWITTVGTHFVTGQNAD